MTIQKDGEEILNRLLEHNRNLKKDYWTEAIAITTSNDSLGPTEISYLEHRFCQLAIDANRYEVKNGNDPTPGNPSEEKKSDINAVGVRTSDGFVVKKGSTISLKVTKSCPEYALKKRNQYKDQIDENGVILEDILFNTPSGAAGFVCGASTNGNV